MVNVVVERVALLQHSLPLLSLGAASLKERTLGSDAPLFWFAAVRIRNSKPGVRPLVTRNRPCCLVHQHSIHDASTCSGSQLSCRHHKRRIVQPSLVDAIAQRLSPSGSVYLSSDVEEVAVDMRRQFEEHASDRLQVSALHDQLPTFSRSEDSHSAKSAPKEEAALGIVPQHQQAASAWAAKGWLQANPMGLETERELSVLRQGLPMYRMVLCRKQQ